MAGVRVKKLLRAGGGGGPPHQAATSTSNGCDQQGRSSKSRERTNRREVAALLTATVGGALASAGELGEDVLVVGASVGGGSESSSRSSRSNRHLTSGTMPASPIPRLPPMLLLPPYRPRRHCSSPADRSSSPTREASKCP